MNSEIAVYKGNPIRFTVVSDNGILLNTKDICAVLCTDSPCSTAFSESCMDIASIIEAAFTDGRDDEEFIDWLGQTFRGYELRTPIRPNCDDDWNPK